MRYSRRGSRLRLLFRAALPIAASLLAPPALADTPATMQWLVTSAKVTGARGEEFVTSVRIVNPNPTTTPVDLFFLPNTGNPTGDNASPAKVSVTVHGEATWAVDDLLSLFGVSSGSGGVRFESRLPVSVLSRTLNMKAPSSSGLAGAYGFTIPAQTSDQAVSAGDTAYVPYISSAPGRTNLFLLSTNASSATDLTIRLAKADGSTVGQADYTLGRSAQTQVNAIASVFDYSAFDATLTAWVTVRRGGPVAIGASVVDGALGSITYVPPFKVFRPNNGAFGLVFADGGYDLSTGRLDLLGGAPDYLAASLVLEGCPSPNPAAQLFALQAWFSTSTQNASFARNQDGSFTLTGGTAEAAWSGKIAAYVDGTLFGTLTYTRTGGPAGTSCPGVSKTFTFSGSRAAAFPPAP